MASDFNQFFFSLDLCFLDHVFLHNFIQTQ